MYYIVHISELMRNATYPEAGNRLYNIIMENIDNVDKLDLDMKGVALVPSMFLNTSIGRFIKEYGVARLKEKVTFSNITMNQARHIKNYVDSI